MGPPRERLETHDGIRSQVEFGLVVNLDFALFDGAPQLALQHQTLPRRAAQAVTERHDAVFPVPFRGDHRAVGLSQHLPTLFSVVRKEADPDTGGHPDRMALDFERLLQDFQRALGRAFGIPVLLGSQTLGGRENLLKRERQILISPRGCGRSWLGCHV